MKRFGSGNFKWRNLPIAAGLFLALLSVVRLVGIKSEYQGGKEAYAGLRRIAVFRTDTEADEGKSGEAKDKTDDLTYRIPGIDFESLNKINPDVVGWILFEHNGISYPVLQGKDNETYLYTLADGTKNQAGSIFMDAYCTPDFGDSHTILYGHNMKDGSMFGSLKQYALQEDYYDKNRCFTIITPQEVYCYQIFAWYEAAADDMVYQVGFTADADFEAFAAQIKKRGCRDIKAEVGREDKIVTLSTCSAKGRRFVVHGVRSERKIGGDENETGRADTDIDEDEEGYAGGKAKMAHGHPDNGGAEG